MGNLISRERVITARTQEMTMADDLGNRGPQDRARISTTEAHEVRYWTKELGVSKERLASVVARVGNSAEAARRELGRYGIRRESGSRRSVSSITQPHEWLA
jgi:hypothetical protein